MEKRLHIRIWINSRILIDWPYISTFAPYHNPQGNRFRICGLRSLECQLESGLCDVPSRLAAFSRPLAQAVPPMMAPTTPKQAPHVQSRLSLSPAPVESSRSGVFGFGPHVLGPSLQHLVNLVIGHGSSFTAMLRTNRCPLHDELSSVHQ